MSTSELVAPHVFSDEYYERLADIEEHHWWSAGIRRIQQRLLDRVEAEHKIARALDAGCGTGLTLTWLKRYAREPIGFDRAQAALRFCVGRGHARLLQADGTELPFASGSFDLVVSCDVIQHLPRPDGDARALAEMARVLVPGGYVLLRTNSRCGYPESDDSPDYHRYSLAELDRKLAAAGLARVRLTYVNFLPALALAVWRKLRGFTPSSHDPGLSARPRHAPTVDRLLYSVLALEALYVERSERTLPFGHSIMALARKPR